MPWAGLDDGFHDDPRAVEAGLAAIGLYTCLTTYCARYLTDGRVPAKVAARFLDGGDMAPLDALLAADLVVEADGQYELPDYLNANPTRAKVLQRKADHAKRTAEWREKRKREREQGT